MKAVLLGLLVTVVVEKARCIEVTDRFLVSIRLDGDCEDSDIDACFEGLVSTLCRPSFAVNCFLKYKVLGEPEAVFALHVRRAFRLEQRLNAIALRGFTKVRTTPLLDFSKFSELLGVPSALTAVVNETLLVNEPQAFWLQIDIEFTGLNGTEVLDLWGRGVSQVLQSIQAGIPIVPLKLSGEKLIHLFMALPAQMLEIFLGLNPLTVENGDRMEVLCKTVLQIQD